MCYYHRSIVIEGHLHRYLSNRDFPREVPIRNSMLVPKVLKTRILILKNWKKEFIKHFH